MALVSLRQLLDHAAENGYGLPAFNVNNLEQIQASCRRGRMRQPGNHAGFGGGAQNAVEAFLRPPHRRSGKPIRIFHCTCIRSWCVSGRMH